MGDIIRPRGGKYFWTKEIKEGTNAQQTTTKYTLLSNLHRARYSCYMEHVDSLNRRPKFSLTKDILIFQ